MSEIKNVSINGTLYDIVSKDDHTHANKGILDGITNKNDGKVYGIQNGIMVEVATAYAAAALPTPSETYRGKLAILLDDTNGDSFIICLKDKSGNYIWKGIM